MRLTLRSKPPYLPNYFDPDQLYNLARDPTETTNLATNPEYAAKLAEMQALLRGFVNNLPGTFADLKEPAPAN